ncbi:MAG: hypothetical protein ACJAYB_003576 [Psychromonas sp.]|jgi:hypothetical protein
MKLFKYMFILAAIFLVACESVPPAEIEQTSAVYICGDSRPALCTMDYRPACGTLSDASVKTYSNGCSACSDSNVASWVDGECQ